MAGAATVQPLNKAATGTSNFTDVVSDVEAESGAPWESSPGAFPTVMKVRIAQ